MTVNPEAPPAPFDSALRELVAEPPLRELGDLSARYGELFLVGGALRDLALGRRPSDLDLVLFGDFDGYLDAIASRRGRRPVDIGDDFQRTHRFHWHGARIDVAEGHADIDADLARRDFTFNSMAARVPATTGALVLDPHDGFGDLRRGVVRATGPGSLDADPVRCLRAVRTVCGLEGFELTEDTESAVVRTAPALDQVANERLRSEWTAVLTLPEWVCALRLAARLGVLAVLFGGGQPGRCVDAWQDAEVRGAAPPEPLVARLAALFADLEVEAEAVLARFGWARSVRRRVVRVLAWHADAQTAGRGELALRAARDPEAVRIVAGMVGAPRATAIGLDDIARHSLEPRWVTGSDLRAWGVQPGPRFGRLLERARAAQLLRDVPDAAALLAITRAALAEDSR